MRRFLSMTLLVVLAGPLSGVAAGDDSVADIESLQLDCVYALDTNGSCAQLETLGYAADDNYGLGNSLTQAPDDALSGQCVNDHSRLACAELAARIAVADNEPTSDQATVCALFTYVGTLTHTPNERVALARSLGPDAPAAVLQGLSSLGELQALGLLETDTAGELADILTSIDAYLYPVCETSPPNKTFIIRSDQRIGAFATTVPEGGTLAAAYGAFGPASIVQREGDLCTVGWDGLGLTMTLANLGGDDACAPDTGFLTVAQMRQAPWRLTNGLAIGDRLSRLRDKYPRATRGDASGALDEWNLVLRREPAGFGGGKVARLVALVKRGRIVAFEVRQPNAGE